ncbi:MAG: iron ABC transporter permease [Thermodesulfobacteriota bacterium]
MLLLSLFIGPSDAVSPSDVLQWIGSGLGITAFPLIPENSIIDAVILEVRLPRILLAFMVGAAMTVSGNSLQALFRNPLVSQDILGLSSGAAFGAALALCIPRIPIQPAAFIFGLLAVGLSYFLARSRSQVSIVSLILSGIIVSGIFTALLTIVQFFTDPFKLQTIVHWTMGNLHHADWTRVKSAALPICTGMMWLLLIRWRLNVIALGDEEARAVGLNPEKEKIFILLPATLIASASVAVAGIIGLVGLAFPHMVRLLVGHDNSKTQPVSLVFGGSVLLAVDNCSRAFADFEIPIGIFTTLIGGPFFVYLLRQNRLNPGEK